jgi:Ca2+-binding EF-hand superfamily protein
MKRFLALVFLLAMTTASATVAVAQEPPPMPPQGGQPGMRMQFQQMPTFTDLDKNKDKKVSREEASQIPPQFFDRLDANHDGFLDEEEWNAMRSGRGGSGYSMGGGPGGGARLGESFSKLLDGDADGKVSREEFAKVLSLFDALDKDHNGDLSPEELGQFFRAVSEVQTQATGGVEVNNLFEKYDKNKDGKITAEEFGNERLFKSLDLNKDGEVTRAEADTATKQLKKASEAKKTAQPNN